MCYYMQAATVEAAVTFEDFRDYASSQHKVTISRVQQLALSKAAGAVPAPSKQLELANRKRDKEPRAQHAVICLKHIFF